MAATAPSANSATSIAISWPSGLPAPGQERRQPGQREQGEVPRVERAVVRKAQPEQSGTLTDAAAPAAQMTMAHRSRRDARVGDRAAGVAGQHQLLPQPFRMLPGELAGQFVEAAHPFDRDQERLVRAQAGCDELVNGAAEMVFELVGVGRSAAPGGAARTGATASNCASNSSCPSCAVMRGPPAGSPSAARGPELTRSP